MKHLAWLAAVILAVAAAACGGRIDDHGQFFVTTTIDVEGDVFPTACGTSGCHAAQNPSEGLDLVSPGVAGRLVGVVSNCNGRLLIDPAGGPSYFVEKVTAAMPECGFPMPWGGTITAEESIAIQEWVQEVMTSSTSTTTG